MPWIVHFSDSDDVDEPDSRPELAESSDVPAEPQTDSADHLPSRRSAYVPVSETQRRRRPGAGRPRGTTGTKYLREALKQQEQQEQQRLSSEQADTAVDPMAHARQYRWPRATSSESVTSPPWLAYVFGGISVVSSMFVQTFDGARRLGQRTKEHLARLQRLSKEFWAEAPPLAPLCVEAVMLRCSRKQIQEDRIALAGLVLVCLKVVWSSLLAWILQQLESKMLEGLMAMTYILADETQTKCRLEPLDSVRKLRRRGNVLAVMQRLIPQNRKPQVAKCLQLEYHIVLVVRGASTGGDWVTLHGELPIPLVSVDRCTSETMHTSIQHGTFLPGWAALAPHFPMFLRAMTTDGASYFRKYKAAHTRLHPESTPLDSERDVHNWNTTLGKSIKVLEQDLSGSIALCLAAMQPAGEASRLRDFLAEHINAAYQIFPEAPPPCSTHPDVVQFQKLLNRVFGSSPSDNKRKMVLQFHFNGGILQYMGPQLCRSSASTAVAQALLPAPIPVWRRSRWIKSMRPLRECTLLFCVGEPSVSAVQRWLGEKQRPSGLPGLPPGDQDDDSDPEADVEADVRGQNEKAFVRNS